MASIQKREKEKVCTSCPSKCEVYVSAKKPSYEPAGKLDFHAKQFPEERYRFCRNYTQNSVKNAGEYAETIRQSKNPLEAKVDEIDEADDFVDTMIAAESPKSSEEAKVPAYSHPMSVLENPAQPEKTEEQKKDEEEAYWKAQNEEMKQKNRQISDGLEQKTGLKFFNAFSGDREQYAFIINNYTRIKEALRLKDEVFKSLFGHLLSSEYFTLRWPEKQEFLKKVNKPENITRLEERIHEAYDYLKIPLSKERENVDRMVLPDLEICKQNIDREISKFYVFAYVAENPKEMYETYENSARAALYSIKTSEFLGFNDEYKQKFFIASLLHDIGKYRVFNMSDKESFDPAKNPEMKEHPLYGADFTESLGKDISAIIAMHHSFQPNGYKPNLQIEETEEAVYLSKLLAIIDCYDAASTRKNGKLLGFADKMLFRKLPSKDKVRKSLLRAYGDLDLKYSGDKLPQSDMKGDFLINLLYKHDIFGNENPINPFTRKDSFRHSRYGVGQ